MIEARPDWVLSRQRAWGVPLTCFVTRHPDGTAEILRDPAVNARIRQAFEHEGADAWFEADAKARFLANDHPHDEWEKVTDILDVWFDSGSTHAFALRDRPDGIWPASLYLEGTEVDFNDDLSQRGFVFKNPSSSGSCGCGASFSV